MRPGSPIDPGAVFSGEKVYIRPIGVSDTEMLLSWRNSEYVIRNFFYRKPISREEHLNWLENKVNKGLVYQFIVFRKDTDEPVGCVYFQGYDVNENSMESGLFMSPDAPRGVGLAGEAYRLMLFDFGKEVLGLSEATARILCENAASIRVHEKLGFVKKKEESLPVYPGNGSVRALLMICDLQKNNIKEA